MKKVFGTGPKKLGEGVAGATQPDHMLSCVQPNLLILVRKLFGAVSTVSSKGKDDMYTSLGSEWPRRQRHPAGVNHSQEHLGKVRAERIIIEGDLLCYSEEEEEEKVGVYIGEAPVSRQHNYFEVEILHMGVSGAISVGLCCHRYPLHKLPGWTKDSIGYHADDGRLYKGKATGVVFGPKCSSGDRMGCGVKYELISPSTDPQTLPVFFTKNGKQVGSVHVPVPAGGLYPCVGLVGSGDAVRLIPHHLWPPDEDTHMSVDSTEEEWKRLYHLRVNGQFLEYSGRGTSHIDVGLAQAKVPLNTSSHYFQLEIIDPGRNCFITIGLTRKNYPKHRHPGWNNGSIAYHGDDGHLFEGNTVGLPFGPPCDKGDIMGCGIIFPRDFVSSCERCGGDCPSEEYCEELDEDDGNESGRDVIYDGFNGPCGDDFLSCVLHYSDAHNGPLLLPNNLPQSLALLSDSEDEFDGEDSEERESRGDEGDSTDRTKQPTRNKNKVQVFFTHNGKMVGRREVTLPRGGFYPSISMGSLHECVKVDLHPLTG